MSQFRGSNTVSMVRRLGLMATASLATMLMASEAQAQCVVNPNQPLNNITTPSTTVTCTGVNNAGTVFVNTDGAVVEVQGAGSALSGNVTLNGNSNVLALGFGSTINNLFIITAGSNNSVEISGQATNIATAIGGSGDSLQIFATASAAARTGDIDLAASAGQDQAVLVQGVLTASSGNGTDYLLTGGTGNQSFTITGTLTGLADGRLINGGDGDDRIFIGPNASITNGAFGPVYFEGGSGTDTITWRSGSSALTRSAQVSGVENGEFIAGAGVLSMGGTADYTNVNITSGVVRFFDLTAMGSNTANFTVSSGATAELDRTGVNAIGQNFAGGGTIRQLNGNYTYSGTGSGFSGAFELLAGANATLTNGNVFGTGVIVNNGTLSWGEFNLSNNISGTGRLIYNGVASTGDLSGNNTFSGGLDVRSGALRVMNVSALGTGTVTSSAGGAILQIDNAANQVLANNLTGALVLVKTNTGTLDLTGTNTFTGGTLIDSGAVRVDDFARLGTGQVITNANGSLILNYNGAGQLLQTTPFMTGGGAFIKEGTGNVVMNQTSTYTGGTTIRAGRIGLNNGAALGTGDIQIDSGAELGIGGIVLSNNLTGSGLVRKTASNLADLSGDNRGFTGTIQVEDGILSAASGNALGAGVLQIDNGTSVRLNNAADTVVNADLTGSGVFEKSGIGRTILAGDGSQFVGGITISGGTVQIEGTPNIGTASVFFSNSGTLQLDTAGNTQLTNFVFGDGNVVKTGTGTVFVTNSNAYTGGTDIQQGAIRVTDTSFLGTGAITVQQGAALDLAIAGQQTLNQSISGAGILRKSDQGDLTLLGNSLTGGVDIVGGRVIVSSAAALGSGPVTTAVDTQLVLNNSATEVFSTPISGGGTLSMNGSGLAVLQNANSYTGGTLINSGRLGLNNGGALGSGVVLVNSGGILGIGNVVLSNDVSGTGQIIKTANGTGQLLGNNSGFSGAILVQEGTLSVASPSALGSGAVIMDGGAALLLDYNGSTNVALGNQLSGAGSLVSNGSGTVVINTGGNSFTGGTQINAGRIGLNFGDGLGTGTVQIAQGATLGIGNVSVGNAITGAGQVVKTASGIGELTGNNAYSGGTDIQGGTLRVLTPSSLGSGNVSIANGASLEVAYAGSTNAAINNALSGAGSLIKSGSGTLVVNNSNSFTGGTSINGGQVNLNFADALGTGAVAINSGAALGIGSISFGNTVTGAGSIMKLGSGNGVLTGTNSHSGGTQILGGNLTVATAAPLGSGAISVASGSSLTIGNASNIALPNAISGTGSLIKVGSGRLDFANPFTIGSLMVDAGRVRVNGVGTTNATVAANGSLDGTGRIIGNLVNNGLVAPGNSIGTLTVQGNYTQNAGSVLEVEFDAAGNIDLLSVTGSATLNGGTVRFVSLGGTEGNGGTFLTATGGITGTFANVETVGAALPLAVIYQPNSALMAPSVLTARPSTLNAQAHAAADTAFGFISNLPGNSEPPVDGRRIWMSGFGTWDDRSASGTTLGYGHNSHGVSGGVTFPLDTGIMLTGAVGWADGSILLSDNGGGGDQSTLLGSLTLRVMDREGYSFAAGLLAGTADQATLRNVSFSGFSASVAGETSSTLYGGYASGYFPFHSRDDFTLSANVRGALIHQSQNAYVESGTSPLRLNVPEINTTTADAEARLSGALQLFDRSRGAEENAEAVVLRFDLGAHYIAALGDRAIPVTFAASNAGITLSGDQRDSLQGLAGFGIGYTTRQGVQFDLGYRAEVGRTDRHSVRAGISFRF